jgi:hypothetical protein
MARARDVFNDIERRTGSTKQPAAPPTPAAAKSADRQEWRDVLAVISKEHVAVADSVAADIRIYP